MSDLNWGCGTEKQGVVTYMLPVEAFVTGIKIYDRQRNVLDCLIVPSKALDHLIFYWPMFRLQLCILGPLLQFGGDPDPLVGSQKEL